MARRKGRNDLDGFVVVDKPDGCTSFDVVRAIRRVSGVGKVGHGGTLDPFATGVLVVGLGAATRLLQFLSGGEKRYRATLRFGEETDSSDRTGQVVRRASAAILREDLLEALAGFVGRIEQIPPRLSAVKVDGRRSYARARAGEDFELAPRVVEVHAIDLVEFAPPEAVLRVRCGGGTYIRSLARDLGRALASAAHLTELRREAVGPFELERAVGLEECVEGWDASAHVLPLESLVEGWPCLQLDDAAAVAVRCGQQPESSWWSEGGRPDPGRPVALLDGAGSLVAVAEFEEDERPRLRWVRPTQGHSGAEVGL